MSAVGEYRDARNSKRWKPYWLAKADAVIAELEADLKLEVGFREAAEQGAAENRARAELAEAEMEKQVWMLDTFMHNRRYMEIRAGYADIFNLVKQDLADDYESRDAS